MTNLNVILSFFHYYNITVMICYILEAAIIHAELAVSNHWKI